MSKIPTNRWTARQPRRFAKAFDLLPQCDLKPAACWADLGCGRGIFSGALAHLLGPAGLVLALDIDARKLLTLNRDAAESTWQPQIHAVRADLRQPLPVHAVDGLLLANVLHFFSEADKALLLQKLPDHLAHGGSAVIVEYNSGRGNAAVPYPLTAPGWRRLLGRAGWRSELRGRTDSSFMGEMVAIQAWPDSQ